MKDYKVNKEKMSDAFCREVYGVVRDVPAGKVISYGEIASLLGKPQCSRMVGRALKQVPSCEFFPTQAVRTNVLGTENVLDSAIEHEVKNVVVLSTDKAAYPINAMGISKAMMEKVAIAKGRQLGENGTTTICCTRYGNVMASRGSVIPLWVEQMKSGSSVTITDPGMTRFMMTLDDAVDLVIYAFQHGNNGDLFVQKAPAATLDVLVRALKELYRSDAEVKVIGTRHGEKLYETLVTREEMAKAICLLELLESG